MLQGVSHLPTQRCILRYRRGRAICYTRTVIFAVDQRGKRSHRHLLHDDAKSIKSTNTYLSFVSLPSCKAVRKSSAVSGLLMVAKQFQGSRQQRNDSTIGGISAWRKVYRIADIAGQKRERIFAHCCCLGRIDDCKIVGLSWLGLSNKLMMEVKGE